MNLQVIERIFLQLARHARISAALLLVIGLGAGTALNSVETAAAAPTAVPVIPAQSFINSVGVNIHETYNDTTYAVGDDPSNTLSYLRRSGIRWVRVGLKVNPPEYQGKVLRTLHDRGVRVLGVVGSPSGTDGGYGLGQSASLVRALTTGPYAGLIAMLELPNEQDLFNSSADWAGQLSKFDMEYYTALKNNASTARLVIAGPSVAFSQNYANIRGLQHYQDLPNVHVYGGTAAPEHGFLSRISSNAVANSRRHRVVVTETGYSDGPPAQQSISQGSVARYLTRALLWNQFHGVRRTFIYELFDEKPDPTFSNREMHFGLVAVDGKPSQFSTWRLQPKPAFVAVRNLLHRVSQHECPTNASCALRRPELLSVQAPQGVYAFGLSHRDGTLDIAVWTSHTAVSGVSITIRIKHAASAELYSTMTDRSRPIGLEGSTVHLRVTQSVRLIRLQ